MPFTPRSTQSRDFQGPQSKRCGAVRAYAMDSIAGTGLEGERNFNDAENGLQQPPSLLVVVLDTDPLAWNFLAPRFTLSRCVADLLVFINAHLAFHHANSVAVLANHCKRTAWLYPSPPSKSNPFGYPGQPPADPNKYRPFALIEHELIINLRRLIDGTTEDDLRENHGSTALAGALAIALSYISKNSSVNANPLASSEIGFDTTERAPRHSNSRVLVISASGNLASQYISLMNLFFAAQHMRVPLDVLKLAGDSVLLQQASYTTGGIFLTPKTLENNRHALNGHNSEDGPVSLIPTLMFAFLPDPNARLHLVKPTDSQVDFRAACFCHRRVVDLGYVCSICLSIFCEDGVGEMQSIAHGNQHSRQSNEQRIEQIDQSLVACLTCGTTLRLGHDGISNGKGDSRRKKKKQKRNEGDSNGLGQAG